MRADQCGHAAEQVPDSQGNVELGSANDIGTLGGFLVTGGTFHLDNGGVANLDVIGLVVATGVTLDNVAGTLAVNSDIVGTSGTVLLSGSPTSLFDLNGAAFVAGPTIILNTGSVAMTGAASLGQTGALLDVTTNNGGWAEAGSATIVAGTLQSPGGIDGTVSLIGNNNAIATLASVGVTNGGTFDLINAGTLNAIGTLTATGITIATTSTLNVAGSFLANGVVNLDRQQHRHHRHGVRERRRLRHDQPDRHQRHDQRDRHADRRHAVRQFDRRDQPDRGDHDHQPDRQSRQLHRGRASC